MKILEAVELRKVYGTGEACVRALDGISLTVEKGEFVAVVGTSGSGKTTLLHMIGGLDVPTSGSVRIRGKEIAKMNDEQLTIFRRRNIGFEKLNRFRAFFCQMIKCTIMCGLLADKSRCHHLRNCLLQREVTCVSFF